VNKLERLFFNSIPITFIRNKSKHIIIPGFKGLPLYDVVLFFYKQINKVGVNERAAAISFNFIMAIPAACIFIFTMVPYLPISKQFNVELLKLTKELTPNKNTYLFVKDFLDDFFGRQRNGLLSFGFLLVIFYASNAMMGIIRAFDKSISETKGWLFHKRFRAIRLTFLIIMLIMAAILILIGQEQLAIIIKKLFHLKSQAIVTWWNFIRWFIIISLIYFGIALIYKFAPSVSKRWPLKTPGAIFATILLLITTILFSYWVNNFGSYNKVYGSIGTVLIIMLLIFINSTVLLIGFELNVSITTLISEAKKREEEEQFSENIAAS
jgi:membrane protein